MASALVVPWAIRAKGQDSANQVLGNILEYSGRFPQRGAVEGIEGLAAHKVRRWLDGRFEEVEVTGAHVCES